jgi:hypothetical protein
MDAGKRVSRPGQKACVSKPGVVNRNHNFSDTSPGNLPPGTVDL